MLIYMHAWKSQENDFSQVRAAVSHSFVSHTPSHRIAFVSFFSS